MGTADKHLCKEVINLTEEWVKVVTDLKDDPYDKGTFPFRRIFNIGTLYISLFPNTWGDSLVITN